MEGPPLPDPQQLYDLAPCGLMIADASGRLLRVNANIAHWLRHAPQDMLTMRLQDLLTMGGRIFYQTHLGPLLRMQGSVAEVKLELRASDGETIPVMVNLAEQAVGERTVMHVAVFPAKDRHSYERELLAQRKRAEELTAQYARAQSDLAAAQAQAEDRAQFAEQMVGIVSHDLRNPLSVIHMSTALLARGSLTEQQRNVVARIDRSVRRAERLIADLLDFTQARLGQGLRVTPAPADLHEVMGENIAELAAAFPERRILHQRVGTGSCRFDSERIAQAVGNLVANAVNYGDPEHPVSVRTECGPLGARISVHNAGPTIPANMRDGLFEPMVRGAVTGTAPRGVGLGLFIVREIARAHGGAVELESTPAAGTTFTISLPG